MPQYQAYATNNTGEIRRCQRENLPTYCLYCAEEKDPKRVIHHVDGCAQCYHCGIDTIIPDSRRFTQAQLDLWQVDAFGTEVNSEYREIFTQPQVPNNSPVQLLPQ